MTEASQQHEATRTWDSDAGSLRLDALDRQWPPASDAALVRAWLGRLPPAPIIAAAWFVAVFAVIVWTWGGGAPRYFPSPDEAVNRLAAQRILETGRPVINEGVVDPEDLRHPRHWVSLDDGAAPAYPPAAYFIQAGLQAAAPGSIGIVALPAAGLAAFAAAMCLLGERRRWLAALAPIAAFPAAYWMLRPWTNMSVFLSLLAFAVLCWTLWYRRRTLPWLYGAVACFAAASAVRPDLSGTVMLAGLAITLAAADGRRESMRAAGAWIVAGAAAVALIFSFNWYVMGDPLQAGYEVVDSRTADTSRYSLPFPFGELQYIFLPNGMLRPWMIVEQMWLSWFMLGPAALLSVAAIAAAFAMRTMPRGQVLLIALGVAAIAWYAAARVTTDGFGGGTGDPQLRHSLIRYWSPIYLLAAIPPFVVAMRARRRLIWLPMTAVLVLLACLGAWEILSRQPESMQEIRAQQTSGAAQARQLTRFVSDDALVYVSTQDKVLWSHYDIAILGIPFDPVRAADSMERALISGRQVYIAQPQSPAERDALWWALAARGWAVAPIGAHGIARVDAAEGYETGTYQEPLAVRWLWLRTPETAAAGAAFTVEAAVTNTGTLPWASSGERGVYASYHWMRNACEATGSYETYDGLRTPFGPGGVAPGTLAGLDIDVRAPKEAGTYCLIMDIVKEDVAWFRERGADVPARTVVVTGAGDAQ